MISAVDTNVLLDVLVPGARAAETSKALLDRALADGALIVSEPVYTELAVQFGDRSSLDTFLDDTGLRLVASSRAALYAASEAWALYLETRELGIQCPSCGERHAVTCAGCGRSIPVRQHVLADFHIGAHARVHANRLLTRDRGFYRTYFKDLDVLSPT